MKESTPILNMIYDVYLFAMMISINLFFFVFVHYSYDLSPNITLLVITLPIIIVQSIKIFKRMTR